MRERARRELGQPAKVTLNALRELDKEAMELGSDRERIEILTMESQTYARLGDPRMAEKLAEECVEMAERAGDPALLAGALNRLGITIRNESPSRSRDYHERALALFQRIGDVRGQARCHNNLGIVAQLEMRPDFGRESLTMAMTLARVAGMPDLSGTAAMNLGVITQRNGDVERARELYGEALAMFAAVKNSELQLYALYNLANLERETGHPESSAELYEATASLAQRIGQSYVEIGAMAGEGLCLLELGKLDAVRVHSAEIEQRMENMQGWFQGRELIAGLRVKTAMAEGRIAEAMALFQKSVSEAQEYDIYSVAWLTAECAELLRPYYPEEILATVQKYSGQVASLGFTELIRKYQELQGLPPQTVG
jgi:tetratricopeptide (TPR) repeat protein